MPRKKNPQAKQLRKARKTLKFWFKAMLSTDLMNRPEHRSEYLEALQIVKDCAQKA